MDTSDSKPGAVSAIASFLKSLAEDGRPVVSSEPLGNETNDVSELLRHLDESARNELAIDAPQFSANAAMWAAQLFYQLCQFTVFRDLSEEQIAVGCAVACPEPRGPEVDWSADLILRHLPRLFQLARHLSKGDPLVQQIRRIAAGWPLSSVSVPGLEALSLDSFIGHAALRRLYADRIVATIDLSRLGDPRVDEVLRTDLGIHHGLAPAIAAKLFQNTHDTH
jgi:hypothetical protein